MFLLDTDTASGIIKDRSSLGSSIHLLVEADWAISSITHMELRFGMLTLPVESKKRRLIAAFLSNAPVLPFDSRAADAAAEVRASLKKTGEGIGYYDPLIAGHAKSVDAILVTSNLKHFSRVCGLELVSWLED
jgi:tRNA(fMet)-specific endonuclease VapC